MKRFTLFTMMLFASLIMVFAQVAPPATSAPTPTQDAAGVISLYSQHYEGGGIASIIGIENYFAFGGATTMLPGEILGGDWMLAYGNLDYAGLQMYSADVSSTSMMHIDVYTGGSTAEADINFSLISPGPVEAAAALTLIPNQWNSFDIPLSSFGAVDMAGLFQYKIDGGEGGEVYIDNIYFYTPAVVAPTHVYADWDGIDLAFPEVWQGAAFAVVANPDGAGNVAQITDSDFDPYAGVASEVLEGTIDLGVSTVWNVDVYADIAGDFLLKLESSKGLADAIEVAVPVSSVGAWETLTIDFTGAQKSYPNSGPGDIISGVYDRIIMLADLAQNRASVWHIDNIVGPSFTAVDPGNDASLVSLAVNGLVLEGFDHAVLSYDYAIPMSSVLPVVTAEATNANATVVVTDVTSLPDAATVVVTSEDLSTTQTYTVNFTDVVGLPLDFEQSTYNYGVFGGAEFSIAVDPENAANHVGQFIKNDLNDWAGAFVKMTTPIDFTTNGTTLTMDIYSPSVGTVVALKLENPWDANHFVAVNSSVTEGAGAWETVTFDFSSEAIMDNIFTVVVIQVNVGTIGDATPIYMDNIQQQGGGGNCPTDLDGSGVTGGGDIMLIINSWGVVCE